MAVAFTFFLGSVSSYSRAAAIFVANNGTAERKTRPRGH